ncbi:alpha-ketoacid dehydrogenase subunit beta [Oenococcus oeni]|uniref:Acetoin dehydrogenase complex, E1 component, beta subunit n=1 Tax=Oenococcus oeni (strain ATCC BAA-331 / PSU-1) TaxID=203123 RepID=Q04GW8_OENOB|nr:alpha-ketoacid dehydrogenase subunit beta [Oenococcus oeni]ABJ56304.1 acetoin dehydrogenase complex, E1 component, beta subunit [Oenococcus oeni PSU-1]KGH81144.1 2-oxoisovalerate dehydrogenase [Oenococcus oeni S14]KZD13138.1 Acetoin dehydrogenase E1 component beta-subunit [Oenococcus oeni]OIK68733.1 alpha-ketoacid dehydrogenase subunit beta [Oenococcus oeni]OIL15791.1 alpha-ketoacid dehydrogenase subunit beta [Oenococcus oeni]
MAVKSYIDAVKEAQDLALEHDKNVLILGEDVGKNGGVFRATDGLQDKYGEDRVFNTPLAESGIGGLAIGLTTQGYRPIMEIQFYGFIYEVLDSLAGQMARNRFRFNGTRQMPIVVRAPYGGGTKTPEMHSDNLEGLVAQTPGLRVVMPSNPSDAKGLLLSAIESNDPVIFLENLHLYRSIKGEVAEGYYTTPLDKAAVVRKGKDISIITYGGMTPVALNAAEELSKQGIDAEIIDLRTVSPLDIETIGESVKKTGRVVVAQETQRMAGIGASVMAEISERFILSLKAPVGRVAAPDSIYPFAQAENDWMVNADDIIDKVKEIVNYD